MHACILLGKTAFYFRSTNALFKSGIDLKTEEASAIQIKRAVDKVLSNQVYLKNVKQLNREFKQYSSTERLEHTTKALVKQPPNPKLKREHEFKLPVH